MIIKFSENAIECNKMRLIHKTSYDIIDNICYILSFYNKKHYSTSNYYNYCYLNKLQIVDIDYYTILKRLSIVYNFEYIIES